MNQRSQRARTLHAKPLWLRVGALVCLLIVVLGAIGQVAHVHDGDTLGNTLHHGHSLHAAGDSADLCPLCVSMHSARPTVTQIAPHAGTLLVIQDRLAAGIARRFRWTLCLASRPPPVSATRSLTAL